MPVLTGIFDREIGGVNSVIVLFFLGLAVFSLQFFCCWKWNNLLIRLIPAATCVAVITTFFILMTQIDSHWQEYFDMISYTSLMLGAVIIGWIVWLIFCYVHNKGGKNPAGY